MSKQGRRRPERRTARPGTRSAGRSPGARILLSLAVAALVIVALVLVATRRAPSAAATAEPTARYRYRIVNVFPHDPAAFTQGLIFRNGYLYESTGLEGKSSLRKVRLETGEVVEHRALDAQYFAEGLAAFGDRLFQLTWRSEIGLIYALGDFKPLGTFSYQGEGWGLASDATRLIMSDGSSTLRFIDPESLRETGRLTVTEGGVAVPNLNELEAVRDQIFANVWTTDDIVIIAPGDGRVVGRIDLTGLLTSRERAGTDVLNGIAWDRDRDRLFVTGKWWPKLFEIQLVKD